MPDYEHIDLTNVIIDGDPYAEPEGGGGGGGTGHEYDIELDGTELTLTEDGVDKTTVEIPATAYGTCSTAAATAAKVATLTDSNWELRVGAMVTIKFTNTNTANNPTLNVNGTGAKSIYYNTAVITTGSLFTAGEANRYTTYIYDGAYWVWIGSSIDRNTTYSAMSKSELTTGTATTSRVVRADYLKAGIKEIAESSDIDTANNTATFTSSDTTDASATSWTSVTKLASGESHTSIFAKMSQMFKNIRYLYKMLGTTDISSIGDGTVTDILDKLSSSLSTVGTTNGGTIYSSVSIAGSGASGNLGELSLDKGTWLIIGGGWCPSSAGIFSISGTNSGQGWGQVNSGVEFIQTVSGIRNITTNNTKVYLQYTNWASNAVVNPTGLSLNAVRIK